MVIDDGETSIFIFGLNLLQYQYGLYFTLLLHDWTDLKYIFLYFVCRKGIVLTMKKSTTISTFCWCLAMIREKGILWMILWWSGILLISLPCMIGIWGPYMASTLLTLFVVIGQYLIWFFPTSSSKICVYRHPTSCCSILALSDPLIYCLWNDNYCYLRCWGRCSL